VDRHLLLERVCSAWAAQMHLAAVFNADPHAGNILVSTDQKDGDASVPILLDFGLTKRFTPEMKVAFARLVHSSYETDIDGLLQSFEEMGLKLNRYDPFQDMHAMQTAFSDPAPQSEAAEIKKQRVKDRVETEAAMREEQGLNKKQKLRNPIDAWPSELIFFSRVSAMLRGLCSRLEVRYPYLECMARAASETLRETTPEHEHAAGVVYQDPEEKYDSKLHKQLVELAKQLIEDDHAIGMQVCVMSKGEIVANIAAGTLGTINPRPVTPASLFNVFSVSKAVLATGVLHMLQEKGISIDDPIAKYWPGWYQEHPDKKEITIRHALAHQAGLADAIPSNASIETLTNWDHMKKFIAGPDAIPSHKPGAETHYHYLNFAYLIGGLLEEVTGKPYEQYLSEHLIKPLGLHNELHMGGLPDEVAMEELAVLTARTMRDGATEPRPDVETSTEKKSDGRARLAKFRGREQLMNPSVFNMRKVRAAKIPSANGHASARALAKLLDTCTTDNNTILDPKTIHDAITIQLSTVPRSSNLMLDNAQASFGLGYQIHELKDISSGKKIRSVGHAGFGGSIVISVPEKQLTIAFTANQLKLKSVARNRILKVILEEFGLEAPQSLVES
jgi:CubicO group peptidase (beta-lactamase class C family)